MISCVVEGVVEICDVVLMGATIVICGKGEDIKLTENIRNTKNVKYLNLII